MNYCSHCGSKYIRLRIPEADTYYRYVCDDCHTIFYNNPRIIVGCLPIIDNRIMLCKRAIEPQQGLWNLPAGFLENGEKAEEGAARETLEESGATVDIMKLHVVFSLPKVNQVYLHYLARLRDYNFGPTRESSEVRLFKLDEIPWNDIAFHSSTYALEKFIEFGPDFQGVHLGSYEGKQRWE